MIVFHGMILQVLIYMEMGVDSSGGSLKPKRVMYSLAIMLMSVLK